MFYQIRETNKYNCHVYLSIFNIFNIKNKCIKEKKEK